MKKLDSLRFGCLLVCNFLFLSCQYAFVDGAKPIKIERAPRIDGVLDEPFWQLAPNVSGFKTFTPDFEKPMGYTTKVMMAYDEENLYFGFRCEDDPNLIKTSFSQRDKIREDDWICINLDSYNDKQSLYALYVNPSGIQMDTRYSNGQEDAGSDFVWYSNATIDDKGYNVEIKIPLKSIRYSVKDERVEMGVIFERKISRLSIQGTYPPLDPEKGFAFLIQSMLLEYEGIKPNTLLEVLPAITYGEGKEWIEGESQKNGGRGDFGLTTKWGITSDLVLDATFNPDFSQVESDATQIDNNIRFALFFPERRPFFLEGRENFIVAATGGDGIRNAVNTRTIVNPDLALKFSGKVGPKNRFSAIYANDAFNNFGGTGRNANVYAGRYIRVLKGDSFIGGIYTQRDSEERSNSVGGADATIRLSQASSFSTHFLNSFTTDRVTGNTSHTHSENFTIAYTKRKINLFGSFLNISDGFTSDVGFVGRTGMTKYAASVTPRIYPKSKVLIRIDNRFTIGQTFDHPSSLWEKNLAYTFNTIWIRKTSLSTGFALRDEVFRGLKFNTNRFNVSLSSQLNKRLTISTSFVKSNKIRYVFDDNLLPYAGRGVDVNGSINWQASNQFNSTLTLRYSNFYRQSDDFKEFDRTIIRSRNFFQFNQFFFLRAILEYDNNSKTLFTDYLASFMLIPGTVVHFGYGNLYNRQEWDPNNFAYQDVDRFVRQRRNFFFKASYLWRL